MATKAIVVEGGAMRGVFASGVLDAFLEQDYKPFDFAIGVSAGASNLIGYLTDYPHRSINVITKLATSKRFFDPTRFLKGGDLIDVKWLFEESNRLYPVDEAKLFDGIPFLATTTNVNTGKADYYRVNRHNFHNAMEATTALPIAYKHTPCFSGGCYTDGGVADSIPVREAHRRGARDITVILSHPLAYEKKPVKTTWLMKKLFAEHPQMAEAMMHRSQNYNESLEFIRNPPRGTSIRVIAPPDEFSVQRLSMRQSVLIEGYEMGLEAGRNHLANRAGEHGLDRENCHFCI
ncbi:patatin family protein [Vibrio rotiferianus]|uniref:patatin-like phospholipase family protein n=1 Tax=Vibrio rotiferianus TaxID=190895 RepID=UPI0011105C43|nr:patatin family protein [Vibrio rotiferianus]TMX33439.1 patatin family protein [Vibrio rotiferianus]TMX48289.1 patatin family protein [Vibrio rotiferianus]TMX64107.1 patatin family protein [Vibrio rotiferianus]CAH1529418.1 Patatin family protein [Vibrio rotiferianus]